VVIYIPKALEKQFIQRKKKKKAVLKIMGFPSVFQELLSLTISKCSLEPFRQEFK